MKRITSITFIWLISASAFGANSTRYPDQDLNKLYHHDGCNFSRSDLEGGEPTWSLRFDNDYFIPSIGTDFDNDDRNYTYSLVGAKQGGKDMYKFKPFRVLEGIDNFFAKAFYAGDSLLESVENCDIAHHGAEYGVTAFTPDSLGLTSAQIFANNSDRPYASLVFFKVSRLFVDKELKSEKQDYKRAVSSELTLGLVGTSLAGEIQTAWHGLLRGISGKDSPKDPVDWDSQIGDGGELVFMYGLYDKTVLHNLDKSDSVMTLGLNIGYYTNASIAFDFRYGKTRTSPWLFNARPNSSITSFSPLPSKGDWYIWGGVVLRYWWFNYLLQGSGSSEDIYAYDIDELERWVPEFQLGMTKSVSRNVTLSFALNGRGKEIKDSERSGHGWGSVYVTWTPER